ncbi:suppressor of gene silencing like protein [Actinidia chinensis var. chinensis]|uniref:Suppressor of gene silencing like protein n=1 Tax=Actinidia chinensis var. chinensis TaxID=1590841 RepID=A0A2R6RV11_ACTCC|nr:suppressor of gene silencing like protein [Actinidia chinensis var. chinensis]
MAGGNHPKGGGSSHHKQSSSSSHHHRKARWESGKRNPPSSDKKPSSSSSSSAANPPTPKSTPKTSSNPKDNPIPKPSPNHPKPPTDPTPHPGPDPTQRGPSFGLGQPPPPAYGFHMLERRTIALADGSVRSYFALPPDYQEFTPLPRPQLGFDRRFPPLGPMSPEFRDREDPFLRDRNQEYWNSIRPDGRGGGGSVPENSLKRKVGDEDERGGKIGIDGFVRQRQSLLQYGNEGLNPNRYLGSMERCEFMAGTSNPYLREGEDSRAAKYMRVGGGYENFHGRQGGDNVGLKHNDVDQSSLKKAFLNFVKLVNENAGQKKNYLENGKQAPLQCVACGRSSKEFPDMHGLILHTYNPDRADLLVDHLGLHKALCVLMGWNYSKPPDNSKAYQSLSADEAAANQDDLIMWPPHVVIHNTNTGKGKEGRIEGLGNKVMDNIIRDLGFGSGKAKSVYSREGHLGITLVKFAGDLAGLKEAVRLAEFFEKQNHGRMGWARVQSLTSGKDNEDNPNLVKLDEKTGEKTRILYGYLGTVFDFDKVDFETRKKTAVESRREYKPSR